MAGRRLGASLFGLGVLVLIAHTVILFVWWAVLSVPYPLYATSGPLYYLSGFTPMIGPLLMLAGGLVYGRHGSGVAR